MFKRSIHRWQRGAGFCTSFLDARDKPPEIAGSVMMNHVTFWFVSEYL